MLNSALFYHQFVDDSATDSTAPIDISGANDSIEFFCPTKLHVFELGFFVTIDLNPGAASDEIGTFIHTTASIRSSDDAEDTGLGGVAPAAEDAAAATLAGRDLAVVLDQVVPDGRVIAKKVDFTLEKGAMLQWITTNGGATGTGYPYFLATWSGQGLQEDGELIAENSNSVLAAGGQDVT